MAQYRRFMRVLRAPFIVKAVHALLVMILLLPLLAPRAEVEALTGESVSATASAPEMVYAEDVSRQVYGAVAVDSFRNNVIKLTENGSRWTDSSPELVFSEANMLARSWIISELKDVSNGRIDVETLGRHKSVVGRLPGWTADKGSPVLVVGAHYDSVPDAPGANDDASGVAGVLELARVMSHYLWPLDIYFCAWNSEEIGLFGSAEVAAVFTNRDIEILQYYNLDMLLVGGDSGPSDERMLAIYNSDTSFRESRYYAELMRMMSCNLGLNTVTTLSSDDCSYWMYSDHASFVRRGYDDVLFMIEAGDDSAYHTPLDTWDNPSYSYTLAVDTVASVGASMAFTMAAGVGIPTILEFEFSLVPDDAEHFYAITSASTNLTVSLETSAGGADVTLSHGGIVVDAVTADDALANRTELIDVTVSSGTLYTVTVQNAAEAEMSVILTIQYDSDVNGDGILDKNQYWLSPGIFATDSDGDLLVDSLELRLGLNIYSIDTDHDVMSDYWEYTNGLDPLTPDADEDPDLDGVPNICEYGNGTNPLNNDTDSDMMPDLWEIQNGLNPRCDDSQLDPDQDGLSNLIEYQRGLDPNQSDTTSSPLTDLLPLTMTVSGIAASVVLIVLAKRRWG